MSQPPAAEPPQDRPDEDGPEAPPQAQLPPGAWQAPGPPASPLQGGYPPYPPPYGAPAAPPNPYGGDSMNYYQPIDAGGMSSSAKVILGVLLGLVSGVVVWFMAVILILGSGSEDHVLLLGSLGPLLVPAPLLLWKATRPWAIGLLAGTAVVSIGLSGLCSSLITPGSTL